MSAVRRFLLERTSVVLLAAVILIFSLLAPRFLAAQTFVNIVIHASSLGIAAVGMTFVLLTAGIDLSVGSIMFLASIVAGKAVLAGIPVPLAILAVLVVAAAFGAINAFFTVRLKLAAFVVTLATLYAGRGLGLLITETRAMNLPGSFQAIGAARIFGVPFPVLVFACVAVAAHFVLACTPFGRQLYAIGHDVESARRAGVPVGSRLVAAYVLCAVCAGAAGFVSVAQVGTVSPSFGQQRELFAIAAAVLGGTSLFGGRGQIFPGTVLGALLMQTVESGLVILNVNPYLYPLITAAIIFVAVAADSVRNSQIIKQRLRRIRAVAR